MGDVFFVYFNIIIGPPSYLFFSPSATVGMHAYMYFSMSDRPENFTLSIYTSKAIST